MEFKKGEIYLIKTRGMEGDDSENIRPVVIVQNNIANKYAPTLIVASITSAIRKVKLPTQIEIDLSIEGIKQKYIILLECIMTISKERLVRKIGILSESEIFSINKALEINFDIRVNKNIENEKRKIEEEKKEMEEYIRNISRPFLFSLSNSIPAWIHSKNISLSGYSLFHAVSIIFTSVFPSVNINGINYPFGDNEIKIDNLAWTQPINFRVRKDNDKYRILKIPNVLNFICAYNRFKEYEDFLDTSEMDSRKRLVPNVNTGDFAAGEYDLQLERDF